MFLVINPRGTLCFWLRCLPESRTNTRHVLTRLVITAALTTGLRQPRSNTSTWRYLQHSVVSVRRINQSAVIVAFHLYMQWIERAVWPIYDYLLTPNYLWAEKMQILNKTDDFMNVTRSDTYRSGQSPRQRHDNAGGEWVLNRKPNLRAQ